MFHLVWHGLPSINVFYRECPFQKKSLKLGKTGQNPTLMILIYWIVHSFCDHRRCGWFKGSDWPFVIEWRGAESTIESRFTPEAGMEGHLDQN
jgi:hypothetical protein